MADTTEQATQSNTWPVIVYPNELEVVEKLVHLADPVKAIEDQSKSFWQCDEKGELVLDAQGNRISLITDDEEFDRAANFALDCNTVEKRIDARREEITKPALKFQKAVNGTLNPFIKRINEVRQLVQQAAHAYKKKKDEEEQKKAQAEREARENEALERAQRLQAAGRTEAANQLLDIAASAPKPVSTTRAVSGGSAFERGRWVGVIQDKVSILKAAIEGRVPLDEITISQSWLNQKARDTKLETVIDGIRITKEENLGLRRS